jgi:hypothetical protein
MKEDNAPIGALVSLQINFDYEKRTATGFFKKKAPDGALLRTSFDVERIVQPLASVEAAENSPFSKDVIIYVTNLKQVDKQITFA